MGGLRSIAVCAKCRTARFGALYALLALYTPFPASDAHALSPDDSALEQRLPAATKMTVWQARSNIRQWQALVSRTRGQSEADKLAAVNRYFNALRFVEDAALWQRQDYWATPLQVLAAGAGDCEDFAIAKYFTLEILGVPTRALRITYVWNHDTPSGTPDPHMVLVYTPPANAAPVVLDILTDDIQTLAERNSLEPVYGLNSEGLWLVGDEARAIPAGSPAQLSQWRRLSRAMKGDALLLRMR